MPSIETSSTSSSSSTRSSSTGSPPRPGAVDHGHGSGMAAPREAMDRAKITRRDPSRGLRPHARLRRRGQRPLRRRPVHAREPGCPAGARRRALAPRRHVDDDGALARALTAVEPRQPVPPPYSAPVSVVIPGAPPGAARAAAGHALLRRRDRRRRRVGRPADQRDDRPRHPRRARRGPQRRPRAGTPRARRLPGRRRASAPGLARAARRALRRPGGAGRRRPRDRRGPGREAARVIPYGRVPFVPGAALVLRRPLRFDPTLPGGEDVDLAWRVHTRYEPKAVVEHDPPSWRKRVGYGRHAARSRGAIPAWPARCTSTRGPPRPGSPSACGCPGPRWPSPPRPPPCSPAPSPTPSASPGSARCARAGRSPTRSCAPTGRSPSPRR